MPCIILGCASCHAYINCLFTVLFASFRLWFFSLVPVAMWGFVRLLHGLGLLPIGIPGKMIITLDITTIFALLVVLMLSLCLATYCLFVSLPNCHDTASNLHHPSKPLFGYVTALLVAGAVTGCFHVGNMDIMGYHNISYLINASIHLVKSGRPGLLLGVCSTLAALVSVIPVLCFMMSVPNMCGYYGDPWPSILE